MLYFIITSELFVCEGVPLTECNGGKKEIASLISGSPIFIYHSREISNPLPDYSKAISYHQFNTRKLIIWN